MTGSISLQAWLLELPWDFQPSSQLEKGLSYRKYSETLGKDTQSALCLCVPPAAAYRAVMQSLRSLPAISLAG